MKRLNEDPQLKEWFRTYYVKWMETCDNLRWITSGRGEKHQQALLPFIPFGIVPSLPYSTLLVSLIDVLICRIPDRTMDPLGNPGYMASIIEDPGTPIRPYIMIECIYGGVIQEQFLFRNTDWETVHQQFGELKPEAADEVIYRKIVKTGLLRSIYNVHQRWLLHGDNALYLIEFLITLLDGIENGEALIDPPLPMFENFRKIMDQLGIGTIMKQIVAKGLKTQAAVSRGPGRQPARKSILEPEAKDFFIRLSPRVPDLVLQTRRGNMSVDLGRNRKLIISEEMFFAILEGFRLHDTLAGFTSHCFELMERSLRNGWVRISGLNWLSRLSSRLFEPRVRGLSGKVQILAKIMANPYRLALFWRSKALIVEIKDGLLSSIKLEEDVPSDPSEALKDRWLRLCRGPDNEFVHLAFALKDDPQPWGWTLKPPGDLSFLQRIEFYPDNDFVRFILRKGPIQLFFNVVMPFLAA